MFDIIAKINNLQYNKQKNKNKCCSSYQNAISDVTALLKDYNIVAIAKTVKLSDVVKFLRENNEYDDVIIDCKLNITKVYASRYFPSFKSKELIFSMHNNVIDTISAPNTNEYKFIYALWLTNAIIIDDMKGCDIK